MKDICVRIKMYKILKTISLTLYLFSLMLLRLFLAYVPYMCLNICKAKKLSPLRFNASVKSFNNLYLNSLWLMKLIVQNRKWSQRWRAKMFSLIRIQRTSTQSKFLKFRQVTYDILGLCLSYIRQSSRQTKDILASNCVEIL